MTNAQTIINNLLSGYVDIYELSEEAQSVLERVRDRVVSSPDAHVDLQGLYGVQDCDDIALGLMWVFERSVRDPERAESTPEEEQVVHTALTTALSRMGLLEGGDGSTENDGEPDETIEVPPEIEMTPEEPLTEEAEQSEPTVAEAMEPADEAFSTEPLDEDPGSTESAGHDEAEAGFASSEETDEVPVELPTGEATTDPAQIGILLEQLVEALQAGADERDHYLVSLRASFTACLSDGSTDDALRRYAEIVDDFLGYVQENELLDDVRVMNFFTNVQEPFSQWVASPEGEREGVLEQAIDFLTDFRAMFE